MSKIVASLVGSGAILLLVTNLAQYSGPPTRSRPPPPPDDRVVRRARRPPRRTTVPPPPPTADDFEFSGEGAQNDLECGKNKDCRYAYRWNAHVHVAADRACRLLGDHARSANRTWPRPVLTLPQLWGSGYWHNPDGEEAAG